MWRSAFVLALGALLLMGMLAACGSAENDAAPTSGTPDPNHTSLAQLIGQPTATATSGTGFAVTGQVKNVDSKQHDIFVQATLKDSSGQVVGTATKNVDNVQGGQTVPYTIMGTLTQPAWSSVSVVISKVTENVNGQGDD